MTEPNSTAAAGAADAELLAAALRIASLAHDGQRDKAGAAYLAHPLRVAARLVDDGPEAVAAGLLHDVLEDSGFSASDLAAAGISPRVIDAVEHVTKRAGEPHLDAVRRAASHPVARLVKLADVSDNSDPARLALLPVDERRRLEAKYAAAREELARTG